MNKLTISGNLVADCRATKNGGLYFRIASGKESTVFIDCGIPKKVVDKHDEEEKNDKRKLGMVLIKGRYVEIDGFLTQWKDKNGNTHTDITVMDIKTPEKKAEIKASSNEDKLPF